MILQALNDYYERKPKIGDAGVSRQEGVPPPGLEEKAISFVIVIDESGRFVNLEDVRLTDGRSKAGRPEIVPMSRDRPGKNAWQTAFLLWDHPRYVLGVLDEKDKPEMAALRIGSFVKCFSDAFPDLTVDSGVLAVSRFYEQHENFDRLCRHELWPEIQRTAGNLSFRLRDVAGELVCQSAAVRRRAQALFEEDKAAPEGICLISGERGRIQVLHAATPLPTRASKSTAKLHSFNERAFESYGKRERQGENAPVSKRAAFAYTTALKRLLRRGSTQKLQIGDATMVFWASRESRLENDFAAYFDDPSDDNPDTGAKAVAELLTAVEQGVEKTFDNQTRFFVLGLAPNSARIAIRFWHVGTVAEMAEHIARHFQDIRIVPPVDRHKEPPFLSIRLLLRSIAAASSKWPEGDPEKVPPNLGGELMRAVLEGLPYPETMFHGAIRRIRAGEAVSYPRAAILKACLNRRRNSKEEKVQMSLDSSNTNSGYRLGRLFAVLERIQEEAAGGHGKINATIRDRFYGAASSAPATVFPMLLRLKNHHLGKIANVGRRKNLEALIGEIVDGLPPGFDPHLSMDNQGRFAVGYYHQRMHPSTYGKQGD